MKTIQTQTDLARSVSKGELERSEALEKIVAMGMDRERAENWLKFHLTPQEQNAVNTRENILLGLYIVFVSTPYIYQMIDSLNDSLVLTSQQMLSRTLDYGWNGLLAPGFVVFLLKSKGKDYYPLGVMFTLFNLSDTEINFYDTVSVLSLSSSFLICIIFFLYKRLVVPQGKVFKSFFLF